DAVDLGQDQLDRDLRGHPAEVPAPLAVAGAGPSAVDPVRVGVLLDQVALPGPAAHLAADPLGVGAPAARVGEADVLLGLGAEQLAAVGVAGRARPVGGDARPFDH